MYGIEENAYSVKTERETSVRYLIRPLLKPSLLKALFYI